MISFERVRLSNFLSYEEAEVGLSGYRGPVLVTGENRDSTSCESNGAGKSAILEALSWCLYGQTLRGLSQREVVRLGSTQGCSVAVLLVVKDEGDRDGEYHIVRYQDSPEFKNALHLWRDAVQVPSPNKRETQARVEGILGVDFALFCESVILGQDSISFATATDAEKKRILEHVAGVERFNIYLGVTKTKLAEKQQVQRALDLKITREQTRLEELDLGVERAREAAKAFRQQQEERMAQLLKERQEVEGVVSVEASARSELQECQVQSSRANVALAGAEERVNVLRVAGQDKRAEVGQLTGQLRSARQQSDALTRELANVKDVCPTCKRPFDAESVEAARQEIRSKGVEGWKQIASFEQSLEIAQAKWAVAEKLSCEAEDRLGVLQRAMRECEKDIERLQVRVQSAGQSALRLKRLDAQIDAEKLRRNVNQDSVDTLVKQLEEVKSELRRSEEERKGLAREVRYLEFWVGGFGPKGVRCYVLDSVANALNRYVAKYSQCLTDGEIEVVFSAQRKLATGGMTEDFRVRGLNRHGADVYKGNSVGERQRVDMAVALALQDLIRSRMSTSIDLFACDEAAANLDRIGAERMLTLLEDLHKEGRSTFYITHDQSLQDLFRENLHVVKEGGVSRLN